MSDAILAKGSDSKFQPHPAGQFVAQCVDTINLGDSVETFAGEPPKLVQKCALVFRTGERNEQLGEYVDIGREFTVSMGDKANLRKFLEQWRGKPYAAEQITAGVPLEKLTGAFGLLTVAHGTAKSTGRPYGIITACVGIPKQMQGATTPYTDYKRADYWDTKKKEYAEAARKFRAEMQTSAVGANAFDRDFGDDDFPVGGDDDLPF